MAAQNVTPTGVALSVRPGVRRTPSPSSPRVAYATSASPRLSVAKRVLSAGTTLRTSRFTAGVLRQYWSKASSTNSTPGVNDTKRYGPAPIGAFLNPSSPTFSTYFFGTTQPLPAAVVP